MPVLIVFYLLLHRHPGPAGPDDPACAFSRFSGSVGFGSALIPLVVIYASLELGDERAPILAGLLGLMLDLASSSHRLGISMLLLSSLSALIATQAHKPESHHWIFRLTYVLVGTFAYLLLEYLFILVETAGGTGRSTSGARSPSPPS